MMRATRAQDAFIDLVCGDEDLVRAEFDALIRANWPDETPDTAPPARRPDGIGRPDGTTRIGVKTRAPVARGGRERAPPAAEHHRAR